MMCDSAKDVNTDEGAAEKLQVEEKPQCTDADLVRELQSKEMAYKLQLEADEELAKFLQEQANQNNNRQAEWSKSSQLNREHQPGEDIDDCIARVMQEEEDGAFAQLLEKAADTNRGAIPSIFVMSDILSRNSPAFHLQNPTNVGFFGTVMQMMQLMNMSQTEDCLTTDQLNTLPTQVYSSTQQMAASSKHPAGAQDDNECAVCLQEYVDGEDLRMLPCLHKYHKCCIDEWLKVKAICPVCKLKVMDELRQQS